MSSNLFINWSLTFVNGLYKVFGIRLTNILLNNTVGHIFTSGETIHSCLKDLDEYSKKNIGSMIGFAVEGLKKHDEAAIEAFYHKLIEAIIISTEGKSEAHFALKITALFSMDTLTRISAAQDVYMKNILKYGKQETITIKDLRDALVERGVFFEEEELIAHFNSLKFKDNTSDTLSRLEIYANAHLFRIDASK